MEMAYVSMPSMMNFNDAGDSSSSSDDSDIEVTSTIDTEENELVRISNDLCLDSDDNIDDSVSVEEHRRARSISDERTSNDRSHDVHINLADSPNLVSSSPPDDSTGSSLKRKRRAWSIREKLNAIESYGKNHSKHFTSKTIGCTRYQLAEWLKRKDEFTALQSLNRGE